MKRILALVAVAALSVGLASAPASAGPLPGPGLKPSGSSSDKIRIPNRPTVTTPGGKSAQWSGTYSHSGGGMLLNATDAAASNGLASRVQAWSNSTTGIYSGTCSHSLGEVWVGSADSSGVTTDDVVIGMSARTYCGNSSPKLQVEAYRNGTHLGWATPTTGEFTPCTTGGVNGCVDPAWITIDNALSSNSQYEMKIQYAHVGTSSEGYWIWVKGSGAIPSGKQGWLGFYRKGIWANAAAPASNGWTGAYTPWRLAFGEVTDPRASGSRCTNMGTGSMPGTGTGAIIDQLAVLPTTVSTDFTQQTIWEDPTIYGLADRSASQLRYGGPGEC